jgi:hypothetical protein
MATPHHYNHWIFNKPNVISSAAPFPAEGVAKLWKILKKEQHSSPFHYLFLPRKGDSFGENAYFCR